MDQKERQSLEARRNELEKNIGLETRKAELESLISEQSGNFAPGANRDEIPFNQAGVAQEDIKQLESVNQRKLAQLQGVGSPVESFGDIGAQAVSYAMNPVREFFGAEKVLPGNFINPIEGYQADETERLLKLAKAGISTTEYKDVFGRSKGVNAQARAVGSLGLTKKDKIEVSKQQLDKQFKTNVTVGVDPETNEAVYLNPLNNRMYSLNPAGLDGGDFTDYLGSGIVSTTETMAVILALKKGKTPSAKKETVAGGLGAAVGEGLRLTAGKLAGTNKELSYTGIAWEATKEGIIALGAGSLFEGLLYAKRKAGTMSAESVIPGHVLDSFKDDVDKINTNSNINVIGEEAVRVVNKALRGVQSNAIVQPNVGQILNDSQVLDVVEALKRGGYAEKKQLIERDASNESALQDYFTLINNNITPQNPPGPFRLAEDIQAVTGKSIAGQIENANVPANQAMQLSGGAIRDIPAGGYMDAGRGVKGALTKEEDLFMKAADRDYTALAKEAEAVNAIPDSFTMKLELSSLDSNQSKAKSRKIVDFLEDGALDLDNQWSITSITDTIKTLRSELRAMDTGVPNAASGTVRKALSILNDFKVRALKDHPDLLEKQQALDAVYAEGKELFHEGIGKKILSTKDSLADSDIFSSIITNGNSNTAKNVATAIMDKPEAMLSMKRAINRLYKKEVTVNGIADIKKHNKFIEKYVNNEIITPFLKDSELKSIRRVGSAGRLVAFEVKKRDAALKKINDLFDNKVDTLEASTLFNKFWGKEKQASIGKLKTILKDQPEVWKSFQSEVMKNIKDSITPLPKGTFSLKLLGETLRNKEGSIKEILGEGYFNNLTTLKEALEVTVRKGDSFEFNQSNALMDIARSYVGVFTREGRFITAANRYRSASSRALLAEMVLDPEKIKKVSALMRARKGSDTARLILVQLGASGLYHVGENDMSEQDYRAYGDLIKEKKNKNKFNAGLEAAKIKRAKNKEIQRLEEQQRTLQSYY